MSPPKVCLAEKPEAVLSYDELPAKKDDKASVTIETSQVRNQRFDHQARRRRRIICTVVVVVVLAAVVAAAVVFAVHHHRRRHHHKHHHEGENGGDNDSYEKHPMDHAFTDRRDRPMKDDHYPARDDSSEETMDADHRPRHGDRWSCLYGKDQLAENVWLDRDNRLIHATHDQGRHGQPSLHVLHEYRRRMTAYSMMVNGNQVCYITRLDEQFDEGIERWLSYEHDGRQPRTLQVLSAKAIDSLVLEHVAHTHIHAMCRNAQSFWAVEIDEREVTKEMVTVEV